MSRKKKSRKIPSNGPVRLSKEKLREMRALKEQRVKKTKGAKPGSRNAPDAQNAENTAANNQPKDKRVGSKKPVSLVAPKAEPKVEMKRNLKPMVELKKVTEPELTPEQELEALENDERLLKLVKRHYRGMLLWFPCLGHVEFRASYVHVAGQFRVLGCCIFTWLVHFGP